MIDVLITRGTSISFDGPRDRWVVQRLRGDGTVERQVEIPLEEMTEEYFRWRREDPRNPLRELAWRAHAESFCLQKLDTPPP